MKKTLTVLLVLAIAMGAVFADEPLVSGNKTLSITTSVAGKSGYGFSSSSMAVFAATPTAFAGDTVALSDVDTIYAYAYDSHKQGIAASLDATAFISDDTDTPMGYTVSVALGAGTAESKTVLNTATSASMTNLGSFTLANATKATKKMNQLILKTIDLNATDSGNAAAGNYTATLKLTITAS